MNQVIWQKGDPDSGALYIYRKKISKPKKERPKLNLNLIGSFLVGAGLMAAVLAISPFIYWEVKYQINHWRGQKTVLAEDQSLFGEVINSSNIKILEPINTHFSLVIPKIKLNSPVYANVAVGDKQDYEEVLKKGVAHADGSFLPGENGTVYLFGHSSDYLWNLGQTQAVFYLLKELEPGDQVNIFYQGDRFVYRVFEKKIVSADDLAFLKPRAGKEMVVLQTCWPLGSNWKRMVVLAERG